MALVEDWAGAVAIKELDQQQVDASFEAADILTNCRRYPRDEAPSAYKDFEQVVQSVESAGLARQVARLACPICD